MRLWKNKVVLAGLFESISDMKHSTKLYNMCKVQLVRQTMSKTTTNEVNEKEINKAIRDAQTFLDDSGLTVLA